jgi:hypothetical protein
VNSGLGTWSIQSGTATNLSVMDMSVWSQLLTFDETALTKKGAYYDLEAYLFEDVYQRFHS